MTVVAPAPAVDHVLDRVLLGDCVERMLALSAGSGDLVLTDPPYLVRATQAIVCIRPRSLCPS